MKKTEAFVALGTNLGDRLLNLNEARRRLALLGAIRHGPVLESAALLPPQDPSPQPAYLNTVDAVFTDLSVERFHAELMRIERQMGRARSTRWAPRVIDLDLILFGEVRLDTPMLTVPHPRMHQRNFVMKPLTFLLTQTRGSAGDTVTPLV